jgi:hypothetical protein
MRPLSASSPVTQSHGHHFQFTSVLNSSALVSFRLMAALEMDPTINLNAALQEQAFSKQTLQC